MNVLNTTMTTVADTWRLYRGGNSWGGSRAGSAQSSKHGPSPSPWSHSYSPRGVKEGNEEREEGENTREEGEEGDKETGKDSDCMGVSVGAGKGDWSRHRCQHAPTPGSDVEGWVGRSANGGEERERSMEQQSILEREREEGKGVGGTGTVLPPREIRSPVHLRDFNPFFSRSDNSVSTSEGGWSVRARTHLLHTADDDSSDTSSDFYSVGSHGDNDRDGSETVRNSGNTALISCEASSNLPQVKLGDCFFSMTFL